VGASLTAPETPARDGQGRYELALYGLLLAWFAARVVYLALRLSGAVPPDELTHLGRALAYARVPGIPEDGPGTYELGLVSHRPWLYYWLMGRIAPLNVFPLSDLSFLRLANGLLGLATAATAIAWMRAWCPNVVARLLFAVLVTNTLMFTGLAAAVSYDNLANLLAALSLYAFTRFRDGRAPAMLLSFLALLLLGCLAKRTFLPLAFFSVVLLAFRERAMLRGLPGRVASLFRPPRAGTAGLAVAVLVLGLLVAGLYGGNFVHYGKLRPGFDQVVGHESAMQNRVYARSSIVDRYRAGEITLAQAEQLAQGIRHRGDRSDTLVLLKSFDRPDSTVLGPVGYASQWLQRMLQGSVGYLGHRRAFKSQTAMIGYFAVFGVAGVLFVRRFRPSGAGGVPADAAFLAFGYALVLLWLVNYPTYLESKNIELAIQGRYLFPVLVPVYGLVAYYLVDPLPARLQPWVASAAAGLFLWGDVPWLLSQIDDRWIP